MWQSQDGASFFHPSSSWLSSPLNTVLDGRSYVLFNLHKIQDLPKSTVSKISISKCVQGCYGTTTIAVLLYRPAICSSKLKKDQYRQQRRSSEPLKILVPQQRRKLGLKFDSGLKPIPASVQSDALQQIKKGHNPLNNLAIQFCALIVAGGA
jgi:hypothetical protein